MRIVQDFQFARAACYAPTKPGLKITIAATSDNVRYVAFENVNIPGKQAFSKAALAAMRYRRLPFRSPVLLE